MRQVIERPSEKWLREVARASGRYRLSCAGCEREDYDGVKVLPKDWRGIYRVQSLRDAMTLWEGDNHDWWTHVGTCPECAQEESQ